MLKYLARQLCNIAAVHKFQTELDKQTRFSDDYYISLTLSQYIQSIGTLLKNIFSSNKISDFKCQSHIPLGPSDVHAEVVYYNVNQLTGSGGAPRHSHSGGAVVGQTGTKVQNNCKSVLTSLGINDRGTLHLETLKTFFFSF